MQRDLKYKGTLDLGTGKPLSGEWLARIERPCVLYITGMGQIGTRTLGKSWIARMLASLCGGWFGSH